MAQDVGGAVAFCKGHMDMGGEAEAYSPGPPTYPGPHTHTASNMGHATLGTHPGTAPLCPAAHTRLLVTWGPGGRAVISSAVP